MDTRTPEGVALQLCAEIWEENRRKLFSIWKTQRFFCYRTAQGDPQRLCIEGRNRVAKEEMLSTGNIAKELDASPKEVKRIIKEKGLEPDLVRGGCSYYGKAKVEIIKQKLKE